ncbi:MAG TPA: hypothetical protein GXX60_03755 [Anaerolineaceae bacterium]|nr:hypothetical protein [Anaerolineaceae bacterium]
MTYARCFNPRLHAGGDNSGDFQAARIAVSIHASTREATQSSKSPSHRGSFNPRLHAGGDCNSGDFQAARIAVSIHASTREATSARYFYAC